MGFDFQTSLWFRNSKMALVKGKMENWKNNVRNPPENECKDGNTAKFEKMTQLLIYNSFTIIDFTSHLYSQCQGSQPARPTGPTHRERVNTENSEIEIMTREHRNLRDLWTPPSPELPDGGKVTPWVLTEFRQQRGVKRGFSNAQCLFI